MKHLYLLLFVLMVHSLGAQVDIIGDRYITNNTTTSYTIERSSFTDIANIRWEVFEGGTITNYQFDNQNNPVGITVLWDESLGAQPPVKYGIISVSIQTDLNSPPTDTKVAYVSFGINPDLVFPILHDNQNYTKQTVYNTDLGESGNKTNNITYYDGIGRPIQNIALQAGGNWENVVTPILYDGLGRQVKKYLPYAIHSSSNVRVNGIEEVHNFYNTDKYGYTENPYQEFVFENSGLNRVLEQGAPGRDWRIKKKIHPYEQAPSNHSIKYEYTNNKPNDNVRLFEVSFTNNSRTAPNLNNNGFYTEEVLHKTITKDENWKEGKDHTIEEFKNKQGQVVLKRRYNEEEAHDTYYVYDYLGNLTYVIPPKVTTENVSAAELKELCYQYIYDHRNRLVQKQLPGKDKEYIVYNKLDQPVLTQDANQRENNEWLFTKYDAFGRVVYTGIYTDAINTDRGPVQADLDKYYTDNANALLYEKRDNANTANHQYTNTSYPTTNIEVFTVNYYDSYGFSFAASTNPGTVFQKEISAQTKGLATGSKIKVLTTDSWINTITYYDKKARPIYTYSNNEYLETIDIVESQLDFVGKPKKIKTTHIRDGNSIVSIDNFSYDQVGRLLAQTQCLGDNTMGDSCPEDNSIMDIIVWDNQGNITEDQEASESITVRNTVILPGSNGSTLLRVVSGSVQELIAYNSYDELGQLANKKVGGAPESAYTNTPGLQEVNYKYNVRGWLTNINDISDATPDKLFNFKIGYTDGDMPLYNGNISNTQWRTDNLDNTLKTYQYNYDPLNRIISATDDTGNYNLSNVTYDKNGNILTLDRTGHTNTGATTFGNMDDLSYAYEGNKLLKVTDGISGTAGQGGFRDGTNTNDDFEYDDSGSLIVDRNKGITDIEYNHMSLPTKVTINGSGGTGTIDYVYDATGMKQRKIVSTGTTTDYAGNYVYENGDLQMFSHDEGYAMPKDVDDYSQGFEYVYNYVDHLGNVRLSYTDADGNGSIDPANEIVEENNFYPFGLKHKGYNEVVSPLGNSTAKKFKYQGQELNNSLGYDMYEFELRHYDPAIGRFVTTDPYEQFDSPYVAMGNNPVVSFDPDGGYCYDANGNQIACPTDAGDFYDDYNESETSHITILDEVEVDNSGSETQTASISEIESFSPIGRLRGTEKMVAEIEMNIFGSRNVQGVLGQYTVDAQGNILTGPISAGNGAIGLIGGFYNPKNLLKVATILDKGGLTKIGRALQKHASRPGSKFPSVTGNVSNINAQGEKVLNSILTNPSSTTTVRHHGRFGEILEIKAPNGQGARFSKDGNTFIGLIEN
ncbi:hypothetical protein B4Q04_20235 [Zobellia sp. OII3]|uniref:DUF6443 domain-containing protein n=1 Tax=Zobellia sp. OII3 TaxID=2034520 RepID=UPI000B538051|nr:DUF6443 domain-containing protein [Zobellia sp. OII3]OWW23528.1 hypothetical protein B4Q04_20235 [Zobellia sp. OII3]